MVSRELRPCYALLLLPGIPSLLLFGEHPAILEDSVQTARIAQSLSHPVLTRCVLVSLAGPSQHVHGPALQQVPPWVCLLASLSPRMGTV